MGRLKMRMAPHQLVGSEFSSVAWQPYVMFRLSPIWLGVVVAKRIRKKRISIILQVEGLW